ncbi:MAG: septum formation initiator family protein [Ignavibacteria bacterium]|nr:septum formation initiator family protein [Ignavibacteria bacterium]
MAKSKKKKIFLFLFLAIFLFGICYLIFNENGLIKYVKLEKEINSLNEQLKMLEEGNENLVNEIDSLKKEVPAKIEQIAREKYDMIKEGETTIEVNEVDEDEK